MQEYLQDVSARGFVKQKESVLQKSIEDAGFIITPEFIAANISCITSIKDKYEHYFYRYGTPEEKRIISINKDLEISYADGKMTIAQDCY